MKKLKWVKPIELNDFENTTEPIKSIVVHYTDSMSHYAVLWQIIKKLESKHFSSQKEMRQEWNTILSSHS